MNKTKLTTTRLFVFAFLLCGLMIIQARPTPAQLSLTVTRSDDHKNENYASDSGYSLREAVDMANTSPTNDTINFAPGLKTITLDDALVIKNAGSLTINGLGLNNTTIEGGAGNNGIIHTINAAVTISGVTLKGGNGTLGGAILAQSGSLTLDDVLVSGNSANKGGGIYFSGTGTNLIINSTISGNTSVSGGGFYTEGSLTIVNSTISGNSADAGGGFYLDCYGCGDITLRNVTITKNTAQQGGGIYIAAIYYRLDFGNTILAGNTGTYIAPEIYSECDASCGAITSAGSNLVGDSPGDSTNTGSLAIAFQPTDIRDTNLMLGALQNNGGSTPTHALLAGSPAIDKGLNALVNPLALAFDQRGTGFARIRDGNGDGTPTVDIGAYEVQSGATGDKPTRFDYDGDGRADISVFRPSNGFWFLNQSANGFSATQFGLATDKLVPADYDGDGKTDIAVYRGGTWFLRRSQLGFLGFAFGLPEDIPQPADFDGDGKAEIAVWRPSNGTWYVFNLATNQFTAFQLGTSGDKPIVGDYDGDGRADYAVFRPSNVTWYIRQSTSGPAQIEFGDFYYDANAPVPADYDGDGKTDLAVFRPSEGDWWIRRNQTNTVQIIKWGLATDALVPADYDGDGKADVAVFRDGIWYIRQSSGGINYPYFGLGSDTPTNRVQ